MRIQLASTTLAYAGLIPFLSAPVIVAFAAPETLLNAETALRVYSALIVSFLAGIHWHVAISSGAGNPRLLVASNAVVLAAWAFAFWGSFAAANVSFALLFVAVLLIDRTLAAADILPKWFYAIRVRVSATVIGLLLTTAVLLILTR